MDLPPKLDITSHGSEVFTNSPHLKSPQVEHNFVATIYGVSLDWSESKREALHQGFPVKFRPGGRQARTSAQECMMHLNHQEGLRSENSKHRMV